MVVWERDDCNNAVRRVEEGVDVCVCVISGARGDVGEDGPDPEIADG